jgi:hypothetical protein
MHSARLSTFTSGLARHLPKVSAGFAMTMLIAGLAPAAHATSISTTVNGTDVIYAAGSQSGIAAGASGTVPAGYSIAGLSSLTFSATGQVMLNIGSGNNWNDPDGVGAAPSSSYNSGYGSISGINALDAGYLVGLFIGPSGPTGSAPASLDYTVSGTSFTSFSPEVDQVFFIGDGLTGDGTGSTQTFYVPTGATELYLGISDACGYSGGPSCYNDNQGTFSVTIDETPGSGAPVVPEPSSIALMGSGALAMAGMLRRRFVRA